MEKKLNQINATVIGLVSIWRTSRKIHLRGIARYRQLHKFVISNSLTICVQQYKQNTTDTEIFHFEISE